MATAFVADTNVVHWIDVNSLAGEVFTTDINIRELEKIPREKPDVYFLDETIGYFTHHRSNILSDSDSRYGLALNMIAGKLSEYREVLVKHVIASCLREGWNVKDPQVFANRVLRVFQKRLRHHPYVVGKMDSETRSELERTVKGFSYAMAMRLIRGERPHYNVEGKSYADRMVVAAAHVLPDEYVYILSNDTDIEMLSAYAKLRLGGNHVKFVNSAESIPDTLKKSTLAMV